MTRRWSGPLNSITLLAPATSVTETPVQLDYAAPTRAKPTSIRISVVVGVVAVLFGLIGLAMPPVVGSGRILHNRLWTPTWWITFALLIAYAWLRLRESRPSSPIGIWLNGLGATGALLSLAFIWIDRKPNIELLVLVFAASFVVAMVGRWIISRQIARDRNTAYPAAE